MNKNNKMDITDSMNMIMKMMIEMKTKLNDVSKKEDEKFEEMSRKFDEMKAEIIVKQGAMLVEIHDILREKREGWGTWTIKKTENDGIIEV